MPYTKSIRFIAMAAVLSLVACEGGLKLTADSAPHGGEVVGVGVPGGDGTGDGTDDGTNDATCAAPGPVSDVPARLLSSQELNHALEVLFPELDLQTYEMPYDSRVGTFILNSREDVTAPHIRDFRTVAEEVAVSVADRVEDVAPCPDATEACANDAVEALGSRAFRRPLDDVERDGLRGLYATGAADGGHAEGMRYVVEALLQAPSFVYVVEEIDRSELGDFEIAQRMASLLWRGVPDGELLEAASNGELRDADARATHARRMLESPRGTVMIRSLFMQWLGLDRVDQQAFAGDPENAGLADAMGRETTSFIEHVATSENPSWQELFTARYTFVDATMAAHYGVSTDEAEEVSEGVWRVEIPDRAGILTHAGFLAVHHGPVHRGLTLRKAVLCGSVASPTGIDLDSIDTFPGESERSKAGKRLEHQTCGGCHLQMDPLGLTFETFDPLGRARTEDEHGNVLSSAGTIYGTGDADGDVADSRELVDRLVESEAAERCVAKHLFVWTYSREVRSEDHCNVEQITTALDRNGGDLRATLVDLVADPAFIQRSTAGATQ